ncbi:efflux RND transporter periplasmic adaptor subunit [Owenweeksia hongkongensis]|uniref:efflux RND transporter periplasmic adaptor subunit n=1 Tax=Owenweeksia hongkongensis TaxID=253245 RepID=UPI003A8D5FE8
MKKVIIAVVVIASIGLVAWKLSDNKKQMAETAKLAEKVSDYIPVELGTVTSKKLESHVTNIGTFEAYTDLTMLAETEGLVLKIYHKKGDFVKKGELLAEVENELLQAEVTATKANYEKLKTDFDRFTKLAEKDAVTERQLEDINVATANAEAQYKSAKKRLEDTYIRATATGTINEDYIQEGSNISRKGKLYDIVDVSQLKLNVKVTGSHVLSIHEGDEVKVTSDIYPSKTFTAKVTAIAAKADNSLKYDIELLMKNSDENPLKAGMFGKAHFEFTNAGEGLYISREALAGSIKEPQVFIVQDGRAKLIDIAIGDILDNEIQVVSGLKEGDEVVVNGQINLKDGTKVKTLNANDDTNLSASK